MGIHRVGAKRFDKYMPYLVQNAGNVRPGFFAAGKTGEGIRKQIPSDTGIGSDGVTFIYFILSAKEFYHKGTCETSVEEKGETMEQTFELYVKIVEGGENARVDTRMEGTGDVRPETLINVLSELVPVVLRENREAIVKLCWNLVLGIRPGKKNQESISVDLPDVRPKEE